jgi:hypothetical protein
MVFGGRAIPLDLTEIDREDHAPMRSRSTACVRFRQSEATDERHLQLNGGSANPQISLFLALSRSFSPPELLISL